MMKNSIPLVSIGMAVYNEDKYLSMALESVCSQDYPSIEIIVCDNASTDKTEEICRSFQKRHPHIQYCRKDKNIGDYANGLSIIEKSNGKYFMYAAGHDLWHPTYISRAVHVMETDPDIVLCYARTMRIDADGNPIGLAKNDWDLRGMPPVQRLAHLVNNISGVDPGYGLVRLRDVKSFISQYPDFVWGQDQVMFAYYSLAGTFAHIPEPLFYWRMTDNENVEVRKKSAPLDNDPLKGRRMLNMSMTELWRQMGEATLRVINRSELSMPEKLLCKDEVRKCFTRRYGVQWNEVVPSQLKSEGKNVLMTTSAAPDQTPFSTSEKRPPIGVGFLISTLREAGHNVFFIDNYLSPSNFLETDYMPRHRIDFVGIYTNSICFRDSLRMFYILEEMRQRGFWNGKIIAGGPHASVSPETIPPFVDHIVIGEGEHAIRDIVEGKVKERIVRYPAIENLDELPMPAWDYFAEMPYEWGGNWLPEAPVFTMNTSRGCPFSCTFCSVCSIWGKRYTYFSAERVVNDIEHLISEYGARGIYFREDNFTLRRDRLVRFCNLLIERNIRIPWVCESRVSNLDRELVALMARAGAVGFYFGVESGSQRLLDFMKKGISVEQIRNAFRWCHEFDIKTAASVIVGVPTETEEDLGLTLALLKEIRPTVTWYNIFVGIPDSELYRYAKNNNLVEFTDDRGLSYLKGHNRRTEIFYGSAWDAKVPVAFMNEKIANPAVSVVMSVHNGEKHLDKAVKSILAQSYLNFELIIIDDASTDSSPEILKSFVDPRIKIITNSENLGLTASLNIGIRAASGKYIARMDADDISVPNRFALQLDYLEINPAVAVVGSSYFTIDEEGAVTGIVNVLDKPADIRRDLPRQNWFGHGSVMFRKSCLAEIGGYDERFVYAQDYDLFLRLSERYALANLMQPLYCWRVSANGISSKKKAEQDHFAEMARNAAAERRRRPADSAGGSPLVSVIVPTHNRPDMLADAISSIIAQSMKSFEIVVVNDAGSDVRPVLEQFGDRADIRYLAHETNRGLAAARNTGIRAARGKYIAYLDDDDVFYPEHLQTLVNFLENSEYSVAYSDAYRAVQEKRNGSYLTIRRETPYSSDFDYDRILSENFIPVLCVMHEKSCLDGCDCFDETLNRHEDWDLWIRMSRKFRFAHIRKITCEYTMRLDGSGMVSGSVPSFLRTFTRICDKYGHVTAGRPEILEAQKQRRFQMMIDTYYFLGQRIDAAPDGKLDMPTRALFDSLLATGATGPEISSAFYQQAGIRVLERPHMAVVLLQKALEFDPSNVIARQKLAEALIRGGNFKSAGDELETLFGQNPGELNVIRTLAHFFPGRNDGKAARYLKLFLEIRPGDEEAVRLLREVECRLASQGTVCQDDISRGSDRPLRISVFSLDSAEDACARIRLIAPLERLGKKVELLWGATSDGTSCSTNLDMIGAADLIVVQRFYPRQGTMPFIERMFASGKPVIYEADDLLLDIPENNHLKPWAEETASLLRNLLPRFTAITVSAQGLAEEFSRFNRNVFVIPNLVDEKLFSQVNNREKDRIVIGFTGTGTHAKDLEQIEEALFRVAAKYGDRVSFFFMGHASSRHAALPGFTFRDFERKYESYAQSLCRSGIDIAVVPLADNSFNRCKSNIKWLEYSACGIAGIYADLPPYNTTVEHGKTGLLVGQDPEKWCRAIEFLVEHPEVRKEIALKARKKVLAKYSLTARAHRHLEVYRQIISQNFASQSTSGNCPGCPVEMKSKSGTSDLAQPAGNFTAKTSADKSGVYLPEKQAVTVSIIIPLYNQAAYTRQCLESLARHTGNSVPFELILVDNGSTDETADLLKSLTGSVTVISNKTNLGFARACNRGAKLAEGRYLLFLNNDTVARKGWLEKLLDGIVKDGADICGAKLVYPDGRVQHAGVAFDERGIGYHIFKGFDSGDAAVNRKRFMQCVTGACMMISTKLFSELGGFDEQFLNGFEDVDLCLRAGAMGKKILYNPESLLVHFEETSEGRKTYDDKNLKLFFSRWKGKIACDDDAIYREEGFVKRRDTKGSILIGKMPPASAGTGFHDDVGKPGIEELKTLCERFNNAPDDRDNTVKLIIGLKSAGLLDEAQRVFSIFRQNHPEDAELDNIRVASNG
jgi:glycosyltransferase involved in cell wall biosynthesis/radical SAM superfamily enzyme YgiQ (UPF0313 family)/spore maturation protein CgeB